MATTSIITGPTLDLPATEDGLARQVRGAVLWRSGSQVAGQLIAWGSTLLVVRLLQPADYGLVAMTGVVLIFLDLFNGWGFASALVREKALSRRRLGQAFALLLLLNFMLAAAQWALAPAAAAWFQQPMVEPLLKAQASFHLANPFAAVANALLIRRMDFRRQSQANLAAAVLSAFTALGCAYAGLGIWTLVAAPFVYWYARAIGLMIAARMWVAPVFDFRGAGAILSYGGAMILVQFCWFIQSQADVAIGGRLLDPHRLGLYTTALFLTQILAAKFVPALNEVAFAAYSRLQDDDGVLPRAFLKTVRLIMAVALPFYFGLAVTAEPLVGVVLGEQWRPSARLVEILALAMPLLTLQILFAPATNALGRPGIALRTGLAGAMVMSLAFLIGVGWGAQGLAWAWLAGMALLLTATVELSLPAIGVARRALAAAVAPGLLAAAGMASAVLLLDRLLPLGGEAARLAWLVPAGIVFYAGALWLFARPLVEEMRSLLSRDPAAPVPAV